MGCDYSGVCLFYRDRLDNMPSTSIVFKKMYCEGHCQNCARHMVASRMGGHNVPEDLMPNDRKTALEHIGAMSG